MIFHTAVSITITEVYPLISQGNDRRRTTSAIETWRYPDRTQRRDGKRKGKGREIGMLVSESHPLTPVFRRIVQSIMPPSLSHHHLRGGQSTTYRFKINSYALPPFVSFLRFFYPVPWYLPYRREASHFCYFLYSFSISIPDYGVELRLLLGKVA